MYYAIDNNLLFRLKTLAASDPDNVDLIDSITAVEANPLINSLIWTKADVVAACRKLIQGNTSKNADGSWFNCSEPFADTPREQLAQEIAGDPDEFCLGMRDEVDSTIDMQVIDIIRDSVQAALEEADPESDFYDVLPGDYVIPAVLPRLPETVLAGGLTACATKIGLLASRELV
jgi:hypothetical protein